MGAPTIELVDGSIRNSVPGAATGPKPAGGDPPPTINVTTTTAEATSAPVANGQDHRPARLAAGTPTAVEAAGAASTTTSERSLSKPGPARRRQSRSVS